MNQHILAIFDSEEQYAFGLMEYMASRDSLPFRIHVFTDIDRFLSFKGIAEIDCLLISEREYNSTLEKLGIPHIIILSESSKVIDPTLHHINKYQSCENIYREMIGYFTDDHELCERILRTNGKRLKVIGVYSPVGRCLQTSFAFTLGQLLSSKSKALYLNFERYSGFASLLNREFSSDFSDLMYYFECAREKLAYRIDSIVENVGGLDFIPPAAVFRNLVGIKKEQWIDLFSEIDRCTEYEYLILDLTDGVLDLWDVLRYCDLVYSILGSDSIGLAKMYQYEEALRVSEYEDILAKTVKFKMPAFKTVPQRFGELTGSELASFIRREILPEIGRLGESDDGY